MLVREAVAKLLKMPQDQELMDEYGEEVITGFYETDYGDDTGNHPYVAYETAENNN